MLCIGWYQIAEQLRWREMLGMKKECSQILEKIIVVFRDLNLHGCKGMGVHL